MLLLLRADQSVDVRQAVFRLSVPARDAELDYFLLLVISFSRSVEQVFTEGRDVLLLDLDGARPVRAAL